MPHPSVVLDVTIPGKPVGASRPRVTRPPNSNRVITHMPDNHVQWEQNAGYRFRAAFRGRAPLDEPVVVEVEAIYHRPKRLRRRKDPRGRLPATCKPDGDNVLKLAMDALTKARIVTDDTRVVDAFVSKRYASLEPLEEPHVRVRVLRWSPELAAGDAT